MVEYAWALDVCTMLESNYNHVVPAISVSLVMLVQSVAGLEGEVVFLPGLEMA